MTATHSHEYLLFSVQLKYCKGFVNILLPNCRKYVTLLRKIIDISPIQ